MFTDFVLGDDRANDRSVLCFHRVHLSSHWDETTGPSLFAGVAAEKVKRRTGVDRVTGLHPRVLGVYYPCTETF